MRSLAILLAVALGILIIIVLIHGRGGMEGSPEKLYIEALEGSTNSITVNVDDLNWGSRIPREYTCDGSSDMPVIEWSPVEGAGSYVVIVYDPDAPGGVFYHLIVYNIPGDVDTVKAGSMPGVILRNSAGALGWYPPCPPHGHGDHRYYFLVIALKSMIQDDISGVGELIDSIKGKVIAYGVQMGVYSR